MKRIPLTQGRFALVDDADFEAVAKHKWYFQRYARRSTGRGITKVAYSMHRELLKAPAGVYVDHINGNCLDNRRCNLRLCTAAQNARNMRKCRGSGRYKGVCWDRGRWKSYIKVEGRSMHLGRFKKQADAALAYNAAALQYFGAFALLNNVGTIR